MAISTIIKTLRDGKLTLGALAGGAFNLTTGALNPGAKYLEVKFENGDFNLTIPGPAVNSYLDRNKFFTDPNGTPSLRYGADQPMTWTFTANLRDLSDAAYATLEEIIMQSGYVASSWESTIASATGCAEVQTYDLKWEIEGVDHCDAADHVIICRFNVVTGSLAEGDPNTISISGTSYTVYPDVIS